MSDISEIVRVWAAQDASLHTGPAYGLVLVSRALIEARERIAELEKLNDEIQAAAALLAERITLANEQVKQQAACIERLRKVIAAVKVLEERLNSYYKYKTPLWGTHEDQLAEHEVRSAFDELQTGDLG